MGHEKMLHAVVKPGRAAGCARPGTWHKMGVMQAEARTGLGILASQLPNFFATVLLGNGFTF